MESLTRRIFFQRVGALFTALFASRFKYGFFDEATAAAPPIPTRPLGKTGVNVTLFGLGGEGVLRTYGRTKEAVSVIRKALDLGVNYFDTAPAYAGSQDYLGEGLKEHRDKIFLASKTHNRMKAGSLRLLENSLRRLKTDRLDLWQLHDIRTKGDVERIFSKDGAIHAMEEAKSEGLVRFLGVTGHNNIGVLRDMINQYPFDTIMLPINAADVHQDSFIKGLVPLAEKKGMGIIGMKILGHGSILNRNGIRTASEAIRYALTVPVSVAIIGCSTPAEVAGNALTARSFACLTEQQMRDLENLVFPYYRNVTSYKASV